MKKQLLMLFSLCAFTLALGQRLTPQQLEAAMAGGERITLIDLRPQESFAKGTLPDAVRMGVREALEKNLTGRVVFFDDGVSVNRARRAADAFSKAGKTAAELAGGFAAWRAAGLPTSERGGLSERLERYVSYQELTGAMLEDAADVVLVDLRDAAPAAPVRSVLAAASEGEGAAAPGSAATNAPAAPLDLSAEFPAYRVTRQPDAAGPQRSALGAGAAGPASGAVQPLYILIDSGDGKADKKAAELRASGCARVAVLAGGEAIIRRKGEPGLVRRGPGVGLATDKGPDQKNMATLSEEAIP
jgi:rhodanese-related sulfurtransferase